MGKFLFAVSSSVANRDFEPHIFPVLCVTVTSGLITMDLKRVNFSA
jgi:hypothetical protein